MDLDARLLSKAQIKLQYVPTSLNGTSSPCKYKIEGKVVESKPTRCELLPIEKIKLKYVVVVVFFWLDHYLVPQSFVSCQFGPSLFQTWGILSFVSLTFPIKLIKRHRFRPKYEFQ